MRPRASRNGFAITAVVVLLCVVHNSLLRRLSWPRGVQPAWLTANSARLRDDDPCSSWSGSTAHSAATPGCARILVLYQITASGQWQDIVRDQVTKLIFSGLYEHISFVHCTVAHNKTAEVQLYLSGYGNKFTVMELSETPTISRSIASMHNLTAADRVLVLSTWGEHSPAANESAFSAYLWRTLIEYELVKDFKRCLQLLHETDVVGKPTCPCHLVHFCGLSCMKESQ